MSEPTYPQFERRHYDFLRITVKYIIRSETWVEFIVAEFTGCATRDSTASRMYAKEGARTNAPETDDFDEAQAMMVGSVRWDGCANYDLQPDECMVHVCGSSGIDRLAEIMRTVYLDGGAMMPSFEGD